MGKATVKEINYCYECPFCKNQINVLKDNIKTLRKIRSFDDFKWGSFQVYIDENQHILINGLLKKTDKRTTFMIIYARDKYR